MTPLTLEGQHVILEPLQKSHLQPLIAAASDGQLWRLWYTSVASPETFDHYIDHALIQQSNGSALPFTVREKSSGEVIGCTRYCHIDGSNRRLEIGYTWYAKRAQRTAVNTECKRLLLGWAFEQWQAIAVEFRTHWMNHASRQAIARLGAKQDGILRNHSRTADGNLRDTVVFSIIQSEWPMVRQHLDFSLQNSRFGDET